MNAVSVIVATFNRPNDLRVCLQHILKQTVPAFETIVVDASPNNESQHVVESFKTNSISYIRSAKGLTRQRNKGIDSLSPTSEWCLFLDDDAIVKPNCIEQLISIVSDRDKGNLGGVGGVAWNESPTSIVRRIFLLPEFSHKRAGLKKSGYAVYPLAGNDVLETKALNGFMMAYSTKVFRDFLFDEYFSDYGYGEDLDFSCRVASQYQVIIETSWSCEHRQSPTSRLSLRKLFKMQVINHFYWFKKNKNLHNLRWSHFFISQCGRIILILSAMAKFRSVSPIIGYLEGLYSISKPAA